MDERSKPEPGLAGKARRNMTTVNSTPRPGQDLDREPGMGGLAGLPGLEAVGEQLAGLIAVLRAEQARRQADMAVTRAAWKNLVFTGGPGCGKTRAARAVARLYTGLGLLAFGQLREIAAADLAGHYPAGDRDAGGRRGPAGRR